MTLGEIYIFSWLFVIILWWDPMPYVKFCNRKFAINNLSNEKFKQHISRYVDLAALKDKDLDETLTLTKYIFNTYYNTEFIMPLWKRGISWLINLALVRMLFPYAGTFSHVIGFIPSIILFSIIFIITATFINMIISLTTIKNIMKLIRMP